MHACMYVKDRVIMASFGYTSLALNIVANHWVRHAKNVPAHKLIRGR